LTFSIVSFYLPGGWCCFSHTHSRLLSVGLNLAAIFRPDPKNHS
jgi:hypothetical protein